MENSVAHRILAYKRRAAKVAELLREGLRAQSIPDDFGETMLRYIYAKYLLDETDTTTAAIAELTDISLAKSQKIDRKLLEDVDRSAGCTSATSAMRKKILLYVAIEKELGITIPAVDGAKARTVHELAEVIYHSNAQGGF